MCVISTVEAASCQVFELIWIIQNFEELLISLLNNNELIFFFWVLELFDRVWLTGLHVVSCASFIGSERTINFGHMFTHCALSSKGPKQVQCIDLHVWKRQDRSLQHINFLLNYVDGIGVVYVTVTVFDHRFWNGLKKKAQLQCALFILLIRVWAAIGSDGALCSSWRSLMLLFYLVLEVFFEVDVKLLCLWVGRKQRCEEKHLSELKVVIAVDVCSDNLKWSLSYSHIALLPVCGQCYGNKI